MKTQVTIFLLFASMAMAAADGPPQLQTRSDGEQAYVLEPGDELDIRFFFNPELNERVTIRPDGRITLPLVGEIQIAGATIADVTQKLEADYKRELTRPQLSIQVRTFGNRNIFVGGEVERPGMFQVFGHKTALEALFEAGGMKPTAKKGHLVLIRRTEDGAPAKILLAMNEKNRRDLPWAAHFTLQPMDVLLVTESTISKVDRVVDQYVRQLLPVTLTGGFSYIWGPFSGVNGRR